jgi:hypothetical protein
VLPFFNFAQGLVGPRPSPIGIAAQGVRLTVDSNQLRVSNSARLGTALGQIEVASADLGRGIASRGFEGQASAENNVVLRADMPGPHRHEDHMRREQLRLSAQLLDQVRVVVGS